MDGAEGSPLALREKEESSKIMNESVNHLLLRRMNVNESDNELRGHSF